MSFLASIYAYPWDLTDEGMDRSLGRIADLAGCQEVMPALSYHVASYFLPHNPARPFYWGEDGAVYFTPDERRYGATKIRPRVSEIAAAPGYCERIVEAVNKRKLRFGAWVVYLFNHHLAQKYPELAKHDALGTRSRSQLSAAPTDVQEYAAALTADIVARFRPAAVHVEALSRMRWSYGFRDPKVLSKLSPRAEFLLSLCFNPASMANADRAGLDAAKFRQDVATWLRRHFDRIPRGEDLAPANEAWIGEAFEGRLRRYLDAGRKHTTALWSRIADVIRRGGAQVEAGPASIAGAWHEDLDPSINRLIERAVVGTISGDEAGRQRVRDTAAQIAKGGIVMTSLQPAQFDDAGPLQQQVHAAAAAGAGGAKFYNYGLMREEQLRFIGTALRTL
jgi:hypothetical protein